MGKAELRLFFPKMILHCEKVSFTRADSSYIRAEMHVQQINNNNIYSAYLI